MTTAAIISTCIIVLCIVLFITRIIPNSVTAVLGCVLFAIFNICTFNQAFSGFSNSIVVLVFGMMVVGIALEDTGAAKLIGHYVTKWSRNNERLFIFLAGTVSAALSTFMSNTAVIAIFLPIIESVSRTSKTMGRKNLTLPVTLGAMFGGVCTLVGSTPQLTANGILSEMMGKELAMFDYLLPGLVLYAVYMLFAQFIGYRAGKKIWGDDAAIIDENAADQAMDTDVVMGADINKTKIVIVLIILALTIVSFVGAWISTAMTAAIAGLLCVITKCTNTKNVFKRMDWSVLFILAGCLGLAAGIANGGVGELLADLMSGIFGESVMPIVIFAVFVLLTMIISNFITNSTAVVITLPIALAICTARGLNPLAFTLGIVYAANLTYSTPLANAQTAMTLVAGYKFSDYIRYTWPLALGVYVAIVAVVPIFFPLV